MKHYKCKIKNSPFVINKFASKPMTMSNTYEAMTEDDASYPTDSGGA
jgi:hypothetical protein